MYHFASLSEVQTVSSGNYQHETPLRGVGAGLTKVCRQIRAEYLPIQRHEAVVAFRWDNIEYTQDWFDTFYPAGPESSGSPCVVRLLWGKALDTSQDASGHYSATDLAMIDDLEELLRVRAHWTSIRFEVALEDSYRTPDESDPNLSGLAERDCHTLGLLLQYDNPTWLTAIRKSIFDSIIIEHTGSRYAPPVVYLEVGRNGIYSRHYSMQDVEDNIERALRANCGMQVIGWDSSIGMP